jgi:hypothetical protein
MNRLGRSYPRSIPLAEHLKRSVLHCLVAVTRNPLHVLRLAESHAKYTDLTPMSHAKGISITTLERQRDAGFDIPAQRFQRDGGLLRYFGAHADELTGCTWLDVGAGTGCVSVYLSEILRSTQFELCDVHVEPRTNFPVRPISGPGLPYPNKSFDIVLFSYVLHHAADDTITLLTDAHRIARRYVVITEDPRETDADCRWAHTHDRHGTFRGLKEWRALFALLGFSLIHEEPLDNHVHSRHLFVLAPGEARGSPAETRRKLGVREPGHSQRTPGPPYRHTRR